MMNSRTRLTVVAVFSLCMLLGCGSARKPKRKSYYEVKVHFATDRLEVASSSTLTEKFGNERGSLSVGTVKVSVPHDHKKGHLERPSWISKESPFDHFTILGISTKTEAEYYSAVSDEVSDSKKEEVLVFVHGFNVTFAEAAYRAAQLKFDLNFDGPVAFFSWPSDGDVEDYLSDIGEIEYAQTHIEQFLRDLAKKTNAKKIHIIAHSMGSRGVSRALKALFSDLAESDRDRFANIVLTAPEIDAQIFEEQIAPYILNKGPTVTLYGSSVDIPLKYSAVRHKYTRLGQVGKTDGRPASLLRGMYSIDATKIIRSWTGHSYLFDERIALTDLDLLLEGMRPSDRPDLESQTHGDLEFFSFRE